MAICEICTNKFRNNYKDRIEICTQCRKNIEDELPNHVSDIGDIIKFPGVEQIDIYVGNNEEAKYLEIKYKKLSFYYFKCDECLEWFIKLNHISKVYENIKNNGSVTCSRSCANKHLAKIRAVHYKKMLIEISDRIKNSGKLNITYINKDIKTFDKIVGKNIIEKNIFEEFSNLNGKIGVWSRWTEDGECLDVCKTKNIGKEMLSSFRSFISLVENPDQQLDIGWKRKYKNQLEYANGKIVFKLNSICKTEEEALILESQLAAKFDAKYWSPEPSQMKLINKAFSNKEKPLQKESAGLRALKMENL